MYCTCGNPSRSVRWTDWICIDGNWQPFSIVLDDINGHDIRLEHKQLKEIFNISNEPTISFASFVSSDKIPEGCDIKKCGFYCFDCGEVI